MAAATLTLGVSKAVTCPTANTVQRVTVPARTRHLKLSSETKFYVQFSASDPADGAAATAADLFLYPAGLWSERALGSGDGRDGLATTKHFAVVPTTDNQVVYCHAVAE